MRKRRVFLSCSRKDLKDRVSDATEVRADSETWASSELPVNRRRSLVGWRSVDNGIWRGAAMSDVLVPIGMQQVLRNQHCCPGTGS